MGEWMEGLFPEHEDLCLDLQHPWEQLGMAIVHWKPSCYGILILGACLPVGIAKTQLSGSVRHLVSRQ